MVRVIAVADIGYDCPDYASVDGIAYEREYDAGRTQDAVEYRRKEIMFTLAPSHRADPVRVGRTV